MSGDRPAHVAGDLAELEAVLAFSFARRELLIRALTHSSYRGESGLERVPEADNEQLEFLGDAVLGLTVSEYLVRLCPEFDEGRLTNVKARLVNRAHLADVARVLNLGRYLVMGNAEESTGGREKASLLANALEALLGAIYLDGGLMPARKVVVATVIADANVRALAISAVNNVKVMLEMLARSRELPKPEYVVHAENTGYPQMFSAEVRVGNQLRAAGRGSSKKSAELEAAKIMLEQLGG